MVPFLVFYAFRSYIPHCTLFRCHLQFTFTARRLNGFLCALNLMRMAGGRECLCWRCVRLVRARHLAWPVLYAFPTSVSVVWKSQNGQILKTMLFVVHHGRIGGRQFPILTWFITHNYRKSKIINTTTPTNINNEYAFCKISKYDIYGPDGRHIRRFDDSTAICWSSSSFFIITTDIPQ